MDRYRRVRMRGGYFGSYEAALLLTERKSKRVEDVTIEYPKPWIAAKRVSEMVVRRMATI